MASTTAWTDSAEKFVLSILTGAVYPAMSPAVAFMDRRRYVALHTQATTEDSVTAGEVPAAAPGSAGYARQPCIFGIAGGQYVNTTTLLFNIQSAVIITHVRITIYPALQTGSAQVPGSDTVSLYHGALETPVSVPANGTFLIPAGELKVGSI